ncbi:lipoprotein [Enterococcus thailandicus]|uniref:LptM family lipoprotein n=1 Tax=Enterococcus thailandicus TaxID=417368 RepID=UPI00244D9566|nr:hypothetical protein [Enterococcus thailandicus]GMC03854.1 lipoprotein [Enterococcus thailandicus]GMC08333.1 lipoprotein [Enterococcus thailandicus]
MKKWLLLLVAMFSVITLSACGSKMNKTAEEFKNKIIEEESRIDKEEYTEQDFSFLIYKDKDTNRYLADVWVPYEGKDSVIEHYYSYDENKELDTEPFNGVDSFDYVKSHGNYEAIYKTGKFK